MNLERAIYKWVPERVLHLIRMARDYDIAGDKHMAFVHREHAAELAYMLYAVMHDRHLSNDILLALENSGRGLAARERLANMAREEEE